jgi:hypothetical protein
VPHFISQTAVLIDPLINTSKRPFLGLMSLGRMVDTLMVTIIFTLFA